MGLREQCSKWTNSLGQTQKSLKHIGLAQLVEFPPHNENAQVRIPGGGIPILSAKKAVGGSAPSEIVENSCKLSPNGRANCAQPSRWQATRCVEASAPDG